VIGAARHLLKKTLEQGMRCAESCGDNRTKLQKAQEHSNGDRQPLFSKFPAIPGMGEREKRCKWKRMTRGFDSIPYLLWGCIVAIKFRNRRGGSGSVHGGGIVSVHRGACRGSGAVVAHKGRQGMALGQTARARGESDAGGCVAALVAAQGTGQEHFCSS
jgi:hypothetical protein